MFGLLGDLASATVKVALTPVAVVKDAVNVATGSEADETKKLLQSAGEEVEHAVDKLTGDE